MYKPVDIFLVNCEEGDWEGAYVDGECVSQGHSLDNRDWLHIIKEFKVFSGVIVNYTFTTQHMDEMGNSFPQYSEQIPIEFLQNE
jgi:hypothetical protein